MDREGNLEKRLSKTHPAASNYQDIGWLNLRFINQLEAASKHHSRSDTYRYMFAMQIAYDALIRLACHVSGMTDSLYLPKVGHRVLERLLHLLGHQIGSERPEIFEPQTSESATCSTAGRTCMNWRKKLELT